MTATSETTEDDGDACKGLGELMERDDWPGYEEFPHSKNPAHPANDD